VAHRVEDRSFLVWTRSGTHCKNIARRRPRKVRSTRRSRVFKGVQRARRPKKVRARGDILIARAVFLKGAGCTASCCIPAAGARDRSGGRLYRAARATRARCMNGRSRTTGSPSPAKTTSGWPQWSEGWTGARRKPTSTRARTKRASPTAPTRECSFEGEFLNDGDARGKAHPGNV